MIEKNTNKVLVYVGKWKFLKMISLTFDSVIE